MLKIGLTGGIGSGKTLVAGVFRVLGIPVYEADAEARRLMDQDERMRESITGLLGEEAYNDKGLNRPYVSSVVFSDDKKLQALNALVHPAVQEDFDRWCGQYTGLPYVLEEAAVLFESGAALRMDHVILVVADERTRIERAMKRDGVKEAVIRDRMRHQLPTGELLKRADFVINNETNSMILPQIVDLHNQFVNRNS